MKQLTSILFILSCFASYGQNSFPHGAHNVIDSNYSKCEFDTVVYMPLYADPDSNTSLAVDANGKLYNKVGGGGGNTYYSGYGLNLSSFTFSVDTTKMETQARAADTLLRYNTSAVDAATFQPIGSYYTQTQTNTLLAAKVNYSDTANMLSTYERSAVAAATYQTILGFTPVTNARTITINSTTYDLTANRTWSVGTVTSVGSGYGITGGPITGSGTLVIDTATLFTKIVSTLGAGYGIHITGRTFTADTATLFANYATTEGNGYGLLYGGRTYILDSATFSNYLNGTLGNGYGILHTGRTFTLDTATIFTKVLGTLGAAGAMGISGRTITFNAAYAGTFTNWIWNGRVIGSSYIGSLTGGQVGISGLSATGTPSATTVLLGNNTWGAYSPAIAPSTAGNIQMSSGSVWTSVAPTQYTTAASYTTSTTITSADIRPIQYYITALTGALLFNNPTGTFADGQILDLQITDNGTARALTYGTAFKSATGITPATTTIIAETLSEEWQYNLAHTEWFLKGQVYNTY